MSLGKFIPPEHLKGRDDFKTASNPSLECPDHIVNSGSTWFCTTCGTHGYAQYEHGYNDMVKFISEHKDCYDMVGFISEHKDYSLD